MNAEIDEKVERLRRFCVEAKVGGVLINTQPNFAWLTAGGTNGVDSTKESGVATLFVRRDGKRFVLANRIEMSRMLNEELSGQNYEPIEFAWEDEKANPLLIAELAAKLVTDSAPLAADFTSGTLVVPMYEAIAAERYQLTAAEIERFRELGIDAGRAIGEVARSLEPGITEHEVARRANDALALVGATAVVTLVAADERLRRYRHPVPTGVSWNKVVMIVVCARRHGLVASLTRIVCAGKKPGDLDRRIRASASVNAKLFTATRPRAKGSELYHIAAAAYSEAGFPGEEKLHHQGGAAGYRTRDWVAHPLSTEAVRKQQAFAWNPSVTGSKVEETCIAFEDEIEIITASPDWPTVTADAEGRDYLLPDVLEL